jgi:hypothetical protein
MKKTDWNLYYSKPFKTALLTRRYTCLVLSKLIKKYVPQKTGFSISEIGGANSCFFQEIYKKFKPVHYVVIDNNQLGLDKFKERTEDRENIKIVNDDILDPEKPIEKTDLVLSIGLIEHFDITGTNSVILNHFKYLNNPGILIIGFPTPTLLYRITRKCAEVLSLWRFPDERPLQVSEVENIVQNSGVVLYKKILWPIFLTQCIMVIAYPGKNIDIYS